MQQNSNTYSAYTIIIALFIMSFLLILTTGVFRLILGELHQNRGSESYLKAFAGAQSGRELALLHIKQNGYGSYDMIPHSINPRSVILSKTPNNHHAF
ncbi:hypothetical protein MK079_05620, partial [Candidatus Gracilibacteria bacterium]|nr:hypothetical protein [Candidatus Gracilibacteria bacterium]